MKEEAVKILRAATLVIVLAACMGAVIYWMFFPAVPGVEKYHFLTWNSNDSDWNSLRRMITRSYQYEGSRSIRVHVLAVQNAPNITSFAGRSRGDVTILSVGADGVERKINPNVTMLTWKKKGWRYYVYHYERDTQNLAIFSKTPAERTVVVQPYLENQNTSLLGVRIKGVFFFNMLAHGRGDALAVLNCTLHYVKKQYPHDTFAVVGDFETDPADLALDSLHWHDKGWQQLVATDQPTWGDRRHDYAVVGGPESHNFTINAQLLRTGWPEYAADPLQHEPVAFNF